MSVVEAGYVVRRHLVSAIDSLSGSFDFGGRQYEADVMKRVFRILLHIEGKYQDAVARRYRVITLLGIFCSIESWRRPFGLERDLVHLLALTLTEVLTKPPSLEN
ncbi:hypothetical protein EV643_1771 [Kribbella sp. VKM Ac-2527]|uniref:Uncharacterized protein n=1 Tax=Kribbella caucasensis TaxID=2512215 RepID=A0A4R6ITT7_9ACTN|nr:hypothetical protein [Kribbella sp. VKM Ac-2527]TDO25979.1 hypothetical protein EV643_1771 [Kribbella sp. VKM Ac-2527]